MRHGKTNDGQYHNVMQDIPLLSKESTDQGFLSVPLALANYLLSTYLQAMPAYLIHLGVVAIKAKD